MLITLILYLKTAGHIFTKVEGYVYQCGKLIHYLVYLWTHITEKSSISHFWNSLMRTLYQHSGSCLFSSAFWFCLPVFAVHSQSLSLQQLKTHIFETPSPSEKGNSLFLVSGYSKRSLRSEVHIFSFCRPRSCVHSWIKLWLNQIVMQKMCCLN